jgi:ABC-type dipeptide/oligopeptide/nickel transport system ATPase subunit
LRFGHHGQLEGGELQRFCIARAVMARPRYLIADEISTMLDAVLDGRIEDCKTVTGALICDAVSHRLEA